MGVFHSIQPFFNKTTGFLFGILVASVLAFYGIIIFWPQDNHFDMIKVDIPKGASLGEISKKLVERQILSNERTFLMAVKTLGYETDIPAGTFSLQEANTNFRIIRQLVHGSPVLKKVTILEGWTVKQIAKTLNNQLGVDEDTILKLCFNRLFAYKLGVPAKNLEGFLFPDTYYFADSDSPENILTRLVDEYQNTVSDEMRIRAHELGFSELELITLASIIEGEAIYDSERPIISAVYHNRLKLGMKLQADPTIQYIIKDSPRRLLNKDLQIESPYNTYLNYGLPPGPINNPGKESIIAALYPEENDYLYFVARGDGYHTFTRTQNEHNREKRKFQKLRRKVWRERRQKQG